MSLLAAAEHLLETLANPSHSGLHKDNAITGLAAAVEAEKTTSHPEPKAKKHKADAEPETADDADSGEPAAEDVTPGG